MKDKEQLKRRRRYLIVFMIMITIISATVYPAYMKLTSLVSMNNHGEIGFFEWFKYGKTWLVWFTVSSIGNVLVAAYSFSTWKITALKKGKITPTEIYGDSRFLSNEEAVLDYSPMFWSEISTKMLDGIVVGTIWIKEEAVKNIKEKLMILRGLESSGKRVQLSSLKKELNKYKKGGKFHALVKQKKLTEEIKEAEELYNNNKITLFQNKLDGILKELGTVKEIWAERYSLVLSEQVKTNVTNSGLTKEYNKAVEAYKKDNVKVFREFYLKHYEEIMTENTLKVITIKAKNILKKKTINKEAKDLKLELKKQMDAKDFITAENTISSIEMLLLDEKNDKQTTKDNKKAITKMAAIISDLIDKNKIDVELSANNTTALEPKTNKYETLFFVANGGLHSEIIGATGSAKTVALVRPTIDAFALSANKPSIVISDVKGELFGLKSAFLKKQGYDVRVLNFIDNKNSSRWNPLEIGIDYFEKSIKAEHKGDMASAGDYENKASESISELASTIFATSEGSKDKYWNESAQKILRGFIWIVFEEYKISLKKQLNKEPIPDHLIKREALNLPFVNRMAIEMLSDEGLKKYYDSNPQRKKTKSFLELSDVVAAKSEQTIGSMVSTFTTGMTLFGNGSVMGVTSGNDFVLENISQKPTALFIIIPDEKDSYNFFGSLFVSQLYKKIVDISRKEGETKKVHFILDEFGNFPAINGFETIITVARSRNVRFHLILQSYSQLDKVYGNNTSKTIQANMNISVYILTTEDKTAVQISNRLGKKTVQTESVSSGGRGSTSTSSTGVPLIQPATLLRQKWYTGIIMASRKFPWNSSFVPYYFDQFGQKAESHGNIKLGNTSIHSDEWTEKYYWNIEEYLKEELNEKIKTINGGGGATENRTPTSTSRGIRDFEKFESIKKRLAKTKNMQDNLDRMEKHSKYRAMSDHVKKKFNEAETASKATKKKFEFKDLLIDEAEEEQNEREK